MPIARTDTALFIHSTGMGPFMWKRLMATVPQGMHCVAAVNRGYAPTDLMPRGTPFSMEMDLAHVKAQIPADTTGLHVVAHSYGGLLALLLTLEGQLPIRSLWLYEPVMFGTMRHIQGQLDDEVGPLVAAMYGPDSLFSRSENGGDDAWLAAFIDYWNGPGAWAAMPDKVRAPMRVLGWKMAQEVHAIGTLFKPMEDYRVEVPLTLVHGEHTTLPARDMSRRLATVNAQARLTTLPGLGHMSVVTDADQVAPSLQAHWARLSGH